MVVLLEHVTCHFAAASASAPSAPERGSAATVMARAPRSGSRNSQLDACSASQYGAPMSVRFANVKGRASIVLGERLVDVERASGGRFSADPMGAVHRWEAFVE